MNNTKLYNFSPKNLLNWITAFTIFEIPLAYFYLSISKKTDTVTDWYSGKTINIWNVIVQDMLYGLCGVILALYLLTTSINWKINAKPIEAGEYEIIGEIKYNDPDQNILKDKHSFPISIKM